MEEVEKTRRQPGAGGEREDAKTDLAELRRELARYRSLFDSARLIVGHELSKPLTAASGYLDLLEERRGDSFDDRDRVYIAKMRSSFARLGELVAAFIEMLRVEREAGNPGAFERVDVRELVEAVRGRFENECGRIVVRTPAHLPQVVARRRCLEIVLENLVSNAVKHGGGEQVTVTVSLAKSGRAGSAGDLLTISVSDRGSGIPPAKVGEIFTPFYRVENGTKQDGLGLGLALVKSVVSAVNGNISVQSAPGEGTTVTVAVPVMSDGALVLDTVG